MLSSWRWLFYAPFTTYVLLNISRVISKLQRLSSIPIVPPCCSSVIYTHYSDQSLNSDPAFLSLEACDEVLSFMSQDVLVVCSSRGWTDEKHMLYLQLLEETFVSQLHDSERSFKGLFNLSPRYYGFVKSAKQIVEYAKPDQVLAKATLPYSLTQKMEWYSSNKSSYCVLFVRCGRDVVG